MIVTITVEFYFADSNLPYDKSVESIPHLVFGKLTQLSRFMWTLHTANEEHWVPIATVSSFKRMREFASLGLPWIVDALKGSEDLEVDGSGEKVRRRTEVKEPAGQFERSVYAVCIYECFTTPFTNNLISRKVLETRIRRCRRN